jgi:hypothetical protein
MATSKKTKKTLEELLTYNQRDRIMKRYEEIYPKPDNVQDYVPVEVQRPLVVATDGEERLYIEVRDMRRYQDDEGFARLVLILGGKSVTVEMTLEDLDTLRFEVDKALQGLSRVNNARREHKLAVAAQRRAQEQWEAARRKSITDALSSGKITPEMIDDDDVLASLPLEG